MNQARVLRAASESEFMDTVVQLAHLQGWRVMHVRPSVVRHGRWATSTSIAGWPDLTLYHPGHRRFLMAELKAENGRVSPAQHAVIEDLWASGVDVRVWRPRDWASIEACLTHQDTAA